MNYDYVQKHHVSLGPLDIYYGTLETGWFKSFGTGTDYITYYDSVFALGVL